MTRLLLLLLLLPIAAHAQAPAMRPPPRPATVPALTPGYSPNTPPEPAYTPPGTGLPEVGQPGSHAAPVPRSPNKRLLPTSSEPGLWAADGAPVASLPLMPPLFGEPLPYPPGVGNGEISRRLADSCVETMTDAAKQAGTLEAILRLSPVVRACMAAHALKVCADAMWDRMLRFSDVDHPPTAAERMQTEALMATANALKVDRCRQAAFEEAGESINEHEAGLLNKAIDTWLQTNKRGKSGQFAH
jgi:hypothetical protein